MQSLYRQLARRSLIVETGGDCALPGGGVNWRGCLPRASGAA